MACISSSVSSFVFKRAFVGAYVLPNNLAMLRHGTPVTSGNGQEMMITALCRRGGLFGVQTRNTQELPVLPSRTAKRWVYSVLPRGSRKNGGSPELLCGTTEKKSPLGHRLSHKVSAVRPS